MAVEFLFYADVILVLCKQISVIYVEYLICIRFCGWVFCCPSENNGRTMELERWN